MAPYTRQDWERDNAGRIYESAAEMDAALDEYCELPGVGQPAEQSIVYEEDEDGWIVASIPEAPGVFSQGRTRDEARTNVLDALRLMASPEPGTS